MCKPKQQNHQKSRQPWPAQGTFPQLRCQVWRQRARGHNAQCVTDFSYKIEVSGPQPLLTEAVQKIRTWKAFVSGRKEMHTLRIAGCEKEASKIRKWSSQGRWTTNDLKSKLMVQCKRGNAVLTPPHRDKQHALEKRSLWQAVEKSHPPNVNLWIYMINVRFQKGSLSLYIVCWFMFKVQTKESF